MEINTNYPEFRVKKDTDTKSLATAIFANIKNSNRIELKCIGIPSISQAIKAIIIARGLSAPTGFDIIIKPHFDMITIEGAEKTAIGLVLEKINL